MLTSSMKSQAATVDAVVPVLVFVMAKNRQTTTWMPWYLQGVFLIQEESAKFMDATTHVIGYFLAQKMDAKYLNFEVPMIG